MVTVKKCSHLIILFERLVIKMCLDSVTGNMQDIKKIDHNFFIETFVKGIKFNLIILKNLEEIKIESERDREHFGYCKGGVETCERILKFIEDMDANEKK